MSAKARAKTIGELRKSGYKVVPVRDELRTNLVEKMRRGEELFPGIIGYSETVIPQIENAVLAGQDIILLGERGQAKSRLIRALVNLLDAEIPTIAGCEINDNPYAPICKSCQAKVAEDGDAVEIAWLLREQRYAEKLATPDISIADLIGEVDPIKVAEGRYLSDELTIHYGLVPRTNRGIFSINELPDLAERIQVGLFNLMEERDVQIKGYRIRLPLDVFVVASANPEDYTNRGRIITPLKDRYGAQIRTHYPRNIDDEMAIMEQERTPMPDEGAVFVPKYIKEIMAELTALARKSPDINQRSGVSVRLSIANSETVVANAYRRMVRLKEEVAVPRITDLPSIVASFTGKVELESFEEGREAHILEELTKKAVLNTFARYLNVRELEAVTGKFEEGLVVETGAEMPAAGYVEFFKKRDALGQIAKRLGVDERPEVIASVVEFVLEGLHLNRRLNRDRMEGGFRYRT